MFGSAPCILDTGPKIHSISVGGLFIVGVARGVADLHAERSRRRSPMDEGQCERAGPVVSEGQEGVVDLHYNQSNPSEPIQVSAHQNQNLTQTQLDDGQRVGCDSIEQDSLNANRDEEEEEDGDRKMKGEDDDDVIVEEEKDSVTAPDTPMTDSSFSDTGSLVELHPSVSPETTCPISPVAGCPDEPSYSNPEGKTHTSNTEPTTTSTTEPTGPTSTTEPSTASLEELGERKDHSYLPQSLHQIAEAFVLQEDYERAVCCVQLERLYHQRRLHNLTTLQEQWERRCRSDGQGVRNNNTNLAAQQLDRLAYICKTRQRPSPRTEKCEAVDSVSVRVEDRCPSRSSVGCASVMEEDHRVTDSTLSQSIYPIKPAAALMNSLCFNDFAALDVAQNSRDSERIEGFHRDRLIDSSLTKGEEREGRAAFTDSRSEGAGQQTEREMEHTTQEGYAGPDPLTDGEISRSKPEEWLRGEEEQEEVAEEEKDSDVCFKALEEISVLAVKEQLTLEEVQQEDDQIEEHVQEEDMFVVEIIRDGAASLDGLAKLITVEMTPDPSLVSILKRRRSVCVENVCVAPSSVPHKHPAKRRVRFKVPDDGFDQDQVGGDSCLLLFLLCLVTVVISLGGTALYCALGNTHSTVCTDFSRNADFYLAQLHRGMDQLRHWLTPGF
uniref:consortin-like isoform X1 n=2 Tax=Oncorhynchus gorbuscha TaxID=8017 RepID=UPI001EAE92E2|nr:consortin-like isoform X1 [Oncorhynchus gorbuscha]